jgi:hypothetical protein
MIGCQRMMMRILLIALVAGALQSPLLKADESAKTTTRSESFDVDPHWDGRQNRQAPERAPLIHQDFGYSRTHHAGKAAGEIGGEFWQATEPAYYAKRIESRSFEDRLSASGTLAVLDAKSIVGWQTCCNVYVGFFNADPRDLIWRPVNFVGFRIQSSNEPDGCIVEVSYGTGAYQADGVMVNAAGGGQHKTARELKTSELLRIPPDGSKHEWSLAYDPAGGAGGGPGARGAGEIVLVLDGHETRLRLGLEHRKIGAEMNHFGVFVPRIPGSKLVAYFDDITINGKQEDFSADPHWDAAGNRRRYREPAPYAYNDFGFSRTDHAGGRRGELGGRFFSCDPPEDQFKAYYGDRVGRLTFEDHLVARGKFAANEFSIDSTFALGWFNSKKQGWPIENFAGVCFDSLTGTGRIVQPLYGTRTGSKHRGGPMLSFVPDGRVYEWTLEYDPTAADGRGVIRFTLGGKSMTMPLNEGDRAIGAAFDRFGVFNMQWANSKWCDVYLDDLAYTIATDAPSGRRE